jgi:hypothetical protein
MAKHPWGRPPKHKTPNEMQEKVDKYFEEAEKTGKPFTITGLTIALWFVSRQSLFDYIDKKGEFSDIVKKAKLRIESWNENALYNKDYPTVGVLFNLKNNYWRKDKQEVEHSWEITEHIVILPAREIHENVK